MQEKDRKKKEKQSLMERRLSRRDFSRIAMTFGVTSTLFAWQSFADAGFACNDYNVTRAAQQGLKMIVQLCFFTHATQQLDCGGRPVRAARLPVLGQGALTRLKFGGRHGRARLK